MTLAELKASFRPRCRPAQTRGMNPVVVHGGARKSRLILRPPRSRGALRPTGCASPTRPRMSGEDGALVARSQGDRRPAALPECGRGLSGDDGGRIRPRRSGTPTPTSFRGRVRDFEAGVERLSTSCRWSPRSCRRAGQSYNINADSVAGRLAAPWVRVSPCSSRRRWHPARCLRPGQPHQRVPAGRTWRAMIDSGDTAPA